MQTLLATTPRRNASDDNMIPLINIVFLLLIFFMIAGQIHNLVPDMQLPTGESERQPAETSFKLSLSANNKLYLNGEEIQLEALSARLEGVEKIVLVIDRRLTAKDLDPLLNELRANSSAGVSLLLENVTNSPDKTGLSQ